VTTKTAAEVLAEAADIIERDGWTQHHFHTPDGCHCALGAIGLASGEHLNIRVADDGIVDWDLPRYGDPGYDAACHAYTVARDALSARVGIHVPSWNDADGRTQDEVVAELRAAAAAAA
jgi:hypothetical protein